MHVLIPSEWRPLRHKSLISLKGFSNSRQGTGGWATVRSSPEELRVRLNAESGEPAACL